MKIIFTNLTTPASWSDGARVLYSCPDSYTFPDISCLLDLDAIAGGIGVTNAGIAVPSGYTDPYAVYWYNKAGVLTKDTLTKVTNATVKLQIGLAGQRLRLMHQLTSKIVSKRSCGDVSV